MSATDNVQHVPFPTLTHGRIVEFCLEAGPNAGQYRPAMVVRVWNDTCAQLQVFTDRGNDGPDPWGQDWFRSSSCMGTSTGTWRWPERVGATR